MSSASKIQQEPNSVRLEGMVSSCVIRELNKENGTMAAHMIIVTASRQTDEKGKMTFVNPLFHRVTVTASGEKAEELKKLSESIDRSLEEKNPSLMEIKSVAIDGKLMTNSKREPFVFVEENNIEFFKKVRLKNRMTFTGKVVESLYNDAYASILLQSADVTIPVYIYKGDNSRKWNDVKTGKIKKGDKVSVRGPLMSETYQGGDNKKNFRCSINTNNFEVLSKKKTKQTKTGITI